MDRWTDRQTDSKGDLTSVLLLFQIKDSRLKMKFKEILWVILWALMNIVMNFRIP
jgi:hypothetical protein